MKKTFTFFAALVFSAAMFGQLSLEPGIPGTLEDLTPAGTFLTSVAYDNKNLDMSKLSLIPSANVIIFSASDGETTYGDEIYVTDGTPEGTMLLKDINPGTASSSPTSFCVSGDKCYFTADDGTHGFELWVTDGTSEGTMMVKDIKVGAGSSTPQKTAAYHGKVLFKAQDNFDELDEKGGSLWVSDGTEEGTGKVFDVEPLQALGPWSYYPMFLELEDRCIFAGDDGVYGRELWVTDGEIDSENTMMILDIMFEWKDTLDPSQGTIGNPDIDWGEVMNPHQVIIRPRPSGFFYPEHHGKGYVTVHNEPWVTDGTPEGTYPLKDLNQDLNANQDGTNNSGYGESGIFKHKFFFRGNFNPWGNQWHVTDGTPEGTTCFIDLEGWQADGTHAGSGNALDYHTIWGDYFVCEGTVNNGYDTVANYFRTPVGGELFITDGDSAHTRVFCDIAPGADDGVPGQAATIIVVNGKLYFNADPSGEANNFELHVATDPTDGTYGTTIKKVFDGPGVGESVSTNPQLFTNMNGVLYMVTDVGTEGAKLVKYDDGDAEKADDSIDWTDHYVPETNYKNPYIADYEAIRDITDYNTGYWAGVGIEEYDIPVNENGPKPNIYPNPASDYIQLKLDQATEANIVVYNTLGKAIWYKRSVANNSQISVREITDVTGLYYIWVRSDEGLVINPVILNVE